jgi:hypothetical protein
LPDRYAADRRNPSLAQCGTISLEFNGQILTMKGKRVYTYHAVSGRGDGHGNFPLDAKAQHAQSTGPIPEGTYWITPSELVTNSWMHPAMVTSAWDNYRIIIHPFPTTDTFGRGGMFIHGGSEPGSAGCIDLWTVMDSFVKDLRAEVGSNERCQIQLQVKY